MIFDLHSHSTASDGVLTPTELVRRAATNNIDILAITDHDTIKGLPEAIHIIESEKLPVKLIYGVEISTLWKNNEIHIVGLNIDMNSVLLNQLLLTQEQHRIERAKGIAEKLSKVGIAQAYEKSQAYAQGDIVSRAHFARFLIDNHFAKDMKRAFKKYLGKSGYAYVPANWCSISDAINAIHASNGQAVLAHPTRYDLTLTKLKTLLLEFKEKGGDGMEVSQSRQSQDDLRTLTKLSHEFELLASQGSDFHGTESYLDLGKTSPLPTSAKPIWHNWPFG